MAPSTALLKLRPRTAVHGHVDAILILLVALGIYCTPSLIAIARSHRQTSPILIVNIFLGWTLIGWVLTLAWAFSAQNKTD